MDLVESVVILLLIALCWFWWDSLMAKEQAGKFALRACEGAKVQLLDQTVALKKIGMKRKPNGHIGLLRSYGFEFSSTGVERRKGLVVVLGRVQQYFSMDLAESRTITVDENS